MQRPLEKRQLIAAIQTEVRQQSGRAYRIDFEPLEVESLRSLLRLFRDIAYEKTAAMSRARMQPWRRG